MPSPFGLDPAVFDSFVLSGVLSGWGATGVPHDALVYVSAKLPGSNVWAPFQLLPLPTTLDGTFGFELTIERPWESVGSGVSRNDYEFQLTSFRIPIVAPFHVLQSPILKIRRWN